MMISRNITISTYKHGRLGVLSHLTSWLLPVLMLTLVPPFASASDSSERIVHRDVSYFDRTDLAALRITELMYHPPDQGDMDGDLFEFLEIKNTGTDEINLTGVLFTDGIDYSFPGGTTLSGGAYIVIASDAAAFQSMYGFLPFGQYLGRLNNAGERLTLSDQTGNELISIRYNDRWPWPISADGDGFSLVLVDPEGGADPDDPMAWRASSRIGGSPGTDDGATGRIPGILVNEVLTHTDDPQQDAVELYNPTPDPVDISGWSLTDDRNTPIKFRIPSSTVIPSGGYIVYYENQFNPNPGVAPSFSFGAKGEDIFLFSVDADDNLTGYLHGVSFPGAETGVSFGRYINSVGDEQFPPQLGLTMGNRNEGPRIGEVVITEIMYHPPDGEEEFVEIFNRTDETITLFDPNVPANTWEIGGLNYSLPEGIELPPQTALLIVSSDPSTFRSRYGIAPQVQILGPYDGLLNNAGETIRLLRPDTPEQDGTYALITVDQVDYEDRPPWPVTPDGLGRSLERQDVSAYGDDPINWSASAAVGGSPGVVTTGPVAIEDPGIEETPGTFALEPAYPNPFNPRTTLRFSTDRTQHVRLVLYDVLGRIQRIVFEGLVRGGQSKIVSVDAGTLAGGTYIVRLEGELLSASRRIVLVK